MGAYRAHFAKPVKCGDWRIAPSTRVSARTRRLPPRRHRRLAGLGRGDAPAHLGFALRRRANGTTRARRGRSILPVRGEHRRGRRVEERAKPDRPVLSHAVRPNRGSRRVAVEDDRHRPVVDELDLHPCAEDTRPDADAERAESGAEHLDERLCLLARCRAREAGSISLPRVSRRCGPGRVSPPCCSPRYARPRA
jgi:hypothetical protein